MKIKTGDVVTRLLGGVVPMRLKVTDVTDSRIICWPWEFDKFTGVEIDDEIDCQVSHLILDEKGTHNEKLIKVM